MNPTTAASPALPLAGLAAVGQRIHDVDADRAEQLARRNASNARVARWGIESRVAAVSL